jgi:micrococcal nuclease
MTTDRKRSVLLLAGLLVLTAGCAAGSSAPPPPGVSFPTSSELRDALPAPAFEAIPGQAQYPEESGEVPQGERDVVERVVDGDTVVLERLGAVRLVGLNTPESVKPGAPVDCHGPDSSRAAKSVLTGREVILEIDPVAGTYDRYERRLGYLWYRDGQDWKLYNLEAIASGDGRAYAYADQQYRYRDLFEDAQDAAQNRSLGLWQCPAG